MSLNPLPFYATQLISLFLKSRISANHDKVNELSINGDILIKGIVSLFQNLFWLNFSPQKSIDYLDSVLYYYFLFYGTKEIGFIKYNALIIS